MADTRTIALHAFCSAKGGVGKSTLSVACAQLLAAEGRRPILIDADLTGTSLADGLDLCAPVMPVSSAGQLDLRALPTGAYHSRTETERLRRQRSRLRAGDPPSHLPYFNDALTYEGKDQAGDCCIGAMFWRHAVDDGVRYLPSSSLPEDVRAALAWLYAPDEVQEQWGRRLAWILLGIALSEPVPSDIILDLPPGLFGFTHQVLQVMAHLTTVLPGKPDWPAHGMAWRIRPFLVTSPDRNDLYTALESYARLHGQLDRELRPIVNRTSEAPAVVRERVRQHFGALGIEQHLLFVGHRQQDLAQLFRQGQLRVEDAGFGQELGRTLRLEEKP